MIIQIKRPFYTNGVQSGFHKWEILVFNLGQKEAEQAIAAARRDNPQSKFRIVSE